jgi:S1-C subfamily serine protease
MARPCPISTMRAHSKPKGSGSPHGYLHPVTSIDWLIVGFCVVLAVYGYVQGFVVGALSLLGFGIGALLGARLAPLLLSQGSHSRYAPLFALLGALLIGGALASGLEGLGLRARSVLRFPGLRTVDGVLGAVLTACVGLGIAWIVGAVALESTSSAAWRLRLEHSTILRELDQLLPPSGPLLNALARFDPLPAITGPPANVAPPTRGIVATRGVRHASASVVRVLGTACGFGIEGSGWVAAPGYVITNAHVVAGESDTIIEARGSPPEYPAQLAAFDAHDDIAVLKVPDLALTPLRIASSAPAGESVAILGYPQDGPFTAEPGRVGETQATRTNDAFGDGPVTRTITSLRGLVRPGNSGGPLVNSAGEVAATVFAAIVGGGQSPGGFAVPAQVVRRELASAEHATHRLVSTRCAA